MLRQIKGIIYSLLLGVSLAVVGVFLMAYVAAVAIAERFLLWFESMQLTLFLISTLSQFLAFGFLAILVGILIGRFSKQWLLHVVLCYLAFLLTIAVGIPLVSGDELSNPFSGLTIYSFPSVFVLPVCLFLTAFLTGKNFKT